MEPNLTARTQITIHTAPEKVWDALTKPELVKKYLVGADVWTDWKVGSPIRYTGRYEGKPFEEKGVIQAIDPGRLLQTTHFSATSGQEDRPENYHLVTYELRDKDGDTLLVVSQDGLSDEKAVEGTRANWKGVLQGLKQTAEALD